MRKYLTVLVLAGIIGPQLGAAPPVAVFGPLDVVRGTGTPETKVWTVTSTSPGSGYLLCVDNAGSRDQYAPVTSAVITLNGAPVFEPRDFKRSMTLLSGRVVLRAVNELTAEVRGEPGAGLALWIEHGSSCVGGTVPPATNRIPTITSAAQTSGQLLLPYAYPVTATDADNDVLAFSLTLAPPGMTIDAGTGAIAWLPPSDGTADVAVRVEDGRGGVATQAFTVTVTVPANRAPQLHAIPDRTIPRGAHFRLALAADDPDVGQLLTFGLTSGPAGAAVNPSPLFDWTPNQLGVHPVTVNVHDPAGLSDAESFTLTVVETNGAPILDPQADGTGTPGTAFVRTIGALDPNPGDTLTFALVSGPSGMSLAPAGGLTWIPTGAQLGSHIVKVKVTDSSGLSDAGTFTIDVNVSAAAAGLPPTAIDDRYSVRRNNTLTVPASGVLGNDLNPSGGSLASALVAPPSRGSVSFLPDGGFAYTPAMPAPGSTTPQVALTFSVVHSGNVRGTTRAQPLVVDLYRDGTPEIVFLSTGVFADRRLIAVHGDTGAAAWNINAYTPGGTPDLRLSMGSAGGAPTLAAADLDGDGYPEILSVHSDDETSRLRNRIAAFNHDGSFRWKSDDIIDGTNVTQTAGLFRIAVADLDGDNSPEILLKHIGKSAATAVGVISEDLVTALDANGHIRWSKRVPASGSSGRGGIELVVADIDLDGRPEVVLGGSTLDYQGNVKWLATPVTAGNVDVAVANLDADPFAEIVYVDRFGQLYCYEHTGAKKWGPVARPFGGSFGQVTIGDVDGDGKPEIVFARDNLSGQIEVRDGDGNLVRTMDNPGFNNQGVGGNTTIFDLNGDGRPEVLYQGVRGSFDNPTLGIMGSLFIFDGPTGTLIHEMQATRTSSEDTGPIVVDVNGDGSAEIVTGGWSDFSAFKVFKAASGTWAQTRPVWNQLSYAITNVEEDGGVPALETINWLTPGLNNFRVNVPLPGQRTQDVDSFTYTASTGALTSNIATVHLDLLPPNTAPRILSVAPVGAAPGLQYVYGVRAVDPDLGETLTFSLSLGPAGMTVDSLTGLLRWTPPSGASGPTMAVVKVLDSQGQSDSQQFNILVGPPTIVPNVIGLATAAAQTSLGTAGLTIGILGYSPSGSVPTGQIVSQDPGAGILVASAGAVNLIVSSGPAPVAVPYLIGKTETTARTLLTTGGFVANVTRAFSNSVPDGWVISQLPAGGTTVIPGSVDVVVSAGSGLALRLSRNVTTADASIPFTVVAYDLNYVESAPAPLTFSVAAAVGPSFGSIPTVAGGLIVPALSTRGAFRVTATDSAGHSTSQAFSVTYPSTPGTRLMSNVYADMSSAISDIDVLAGQARLARIANDTPAMRSLLDQMVRRWKLIDTREIRLTTPFGLEQGFFPAPADLASLGLTPTADDLAAQHVLQDAVTDLQALIDGLRAPNTSMSELRTLVRQFNSRAARMDALTLSEWGVIQGRAAMTVIVTDLVPKFYDALMADLAQVVARTEPDPDDILSGPSAGSPSTLAEMLTSIAVEFVIEAITDWASQTYKNAKQFVKDIMFQAAWSAGVVAAAHHFKDAVNGENLTAIVSGASLSFREFESYYAFLEGDFVPDTPGANVVMMIGPDILTSALTAAGVKEDAEKASKADNIFEALNKILDLIKAGGEKFGEFHDAVQNAFPEGAQSLKGCIFSSAPSCSQLFYFTGFKSVYTYTAPVGGMSGLPVPILFVVYNTVTGNVYVDTPVFMPFRK